MGCHIVKCSEDSEVKHRVLWTTCTFRAEVAQGLGFRMISGGQLQDVARCCKSPHSEAPAAGKGKAKGLKGPGKGPPVTRRSFVGVRGFLVLFLLCGGVGMSLSSCCLQLSFRMRKESSRWGLHPASESETAQVKGKGAPPPQTEQKEAAFREVSIMVVMAFAGAVNFDHSNTFLQVCASHEKKRLLC